jgi:1,2-phenylacetyl-CoA epoxidase catalytic subunit
MSFRLVIMRDSSFIPGDYAAASYTAEQSSQFAQAFSSITQKMICSLGDGLPPESDAMQEAVREHYEFILRFWKPDRETYKSLAMSYILPTEFNEHYAAQADGLGQYIYKAVCVFADENL